MSSIIKTYSTVTPLYITPTLYILGEKCYFEKENGKSTIVNTKNWHHYWSEYGWTKIDDVWIKRLNSFCEVKPRNNLFGLLDCGSNGDCLFHCIAQALNQDYEIPKWSAVDIRTSVSKQIDKYNYDSIIETYRLQEQFNEFEGLWEPTKVKSVREFRNILETMGNTFWGDHIIIQLLENAFNINIVLLKKYSEELYDKNEIKQGSQIYPLGTDLDTSRKTLFLCYEDEVHFTLVGYFNGHIVKSLFNWIEIPPEILAIYNKDCSADYSR